MFVQLGVRLFIDALFGEYNDRIPSMDVVSFEGGEK